MTNDIKQQAEVIVEKYRNILPFKLAPNYAIKCAILCAITEVEACIETANDSIAFKQSKRDRLNDILSHLKQM